MDTADFDPAAGTAMNLTSAGGSDAFAWKLTGAGALDFVAQIGGGGDDRARAIALDGAGDIYTTGFFTGTVDFDPGADVTNLMSDGTGDVFISKLDSLGKFFYARSFAGSGGDSGRSIAVSPGGDVHTTGSFAGTADFNPGAATFNLTSRGDSDIFVSKLSAGTQDFGDAPFTGPVVGAPSFNYPTTLASGQAALHGPTGPRLGAARDAEFDGQPTTPAGGDDDNGLPDDEDGVKFLTSIVSSAGTANTATVLVNLQNAGTNNRLDAFIDFNRDGDWSDAGETILASASVTAGNNAIAFSVPPGASVGATYARFRVSTAGGYAAGGGAADGEVEDYQITIIDEAAAAIVSLPPGAGTAEILVVGASRVVRRGGTNLFAVPSTAIGSLAIGGNDADDDALRVILAVDPIPAGGLSFNGGVGGNDTLELAGGVFNMVNFVFNNATDGGVDLDPDGPGGVAASRITYTGLDPILSTVAATNVQFAYSAATETITLADSGVAGRTLATSTAGESVTFTNPSGMLTINAGDTGDDTIDVTGAGSGFAAGIRIDGGTGNDAITFAGPAAPASLALGAETIEIQAAAITTTSNQNYLGPTELRGDTNLAGGEITFTSTLDSVAASGPVSLNVNTTGNSATRFLGAVGGTTRLASIATNADGRTELAANVNLNGAAATTFLDNVALSANVAFDQDGAGGVTFGAFLDSALGTTFSLSIDGVGASSPVSLGASGTGVPLAGLTVATTGTITLGGNIFTSGGAVDLDNAAAASVDLVAAVVIDTDQAGVGAAGAVAINRPINGAQSLVIDATTDTADAAGDITLSSVGATTPLDGLAAAGNSVVIGGDVVTTGSVALRGANAVAVDDINADAATVMIAANEDAAGPEGFTQAAGTTIRTTNDTDMAISISVNATGGGTGSADIRTLTAGLTSGPTGGRVVVFTANGALRDGDGGGAINVTAGNVLLGGLSIGTATDPIETMAGRLEGGELGSGFFVSDGGTVAIGGISGMVAGIESRGGDVAVFAATAITVNEAVSAAGAGAITLNARGFDAGDLVLNAPVSAVSGAITLVADDDIVSSAAGTITTTSGAVALTADDDMNASGTIRLLGSVDHGSAGSTWSLADLDGVAAPISGGGGLTKAGLGLLTLPAANTYMGATTINAGGLHVTGSTAAASAFAVNAGAALGGTGAIGGAVAVNGGTLAPGLTPGVLATGALTFTGGTFAVEINGTTPGTDHDQLAITGTTSVAGATLTLAVGGAIVDGGEYLVIANDGTDAVVGELMDVGGATLAEGAVIVLGGKTVRLTYAGGDGNDVAIIADGPVVVPPGAVDGAPDVISAVRVAGNVRFLVNGVPRVLRPFAGVTSVAYDGTTDNDTLIVDSSGGPLVPPGGLIYNGGAGGNDSLSLVGGSFTRTTYSFTNANDGTVDLDAATVTFTGLEPISNTGTATDVVFNLPAAAVDAVIEDFAASGDDLSRLRSANGTFESTVFRSPTGSLAINAGVGDDTITLAGVDALFAAATTVRGDGGADRLDAGGFVLPVRLEGDAGPDMLLGGSADDVLIGGDGDDNLLGGGGIDRLEGDAVTNQANNNIAIIGNDMLDGGPGIDVMFGGPVGGQPNDVDSFVCDTTQDLTTITLGEDTSIGCEGAVVLPPGNANVFVADPAGGFIAGTPDNDVFIGQQGDDTFDAGAGNDVLLGGGGNDSMLCGEGDDVASGGAGDDTTSCGDGDDVVSGGPGNDRMNGDGGDVVIGGGPANTGAADADGIRCGPGLDVVFVTNGEDRIGDCPDALLFDERDQGRLAFVQPGVPYVASDDGEIVYGTRGSDTVTGGAGKDFLIGRRGDDVLRAGAGDDHVIAGPGDDMLFGDDGNDQLLGCQGRDHIEGGADVDGLYGGGDDDMLFGGSAADAGLAAALGTRSSEVSARTTSGPTAIAGLVAGADDDFIEGGLGNDTAFGGEGDDVIVDLGDGAADSRLTAPATADAITIVVRDRLPIGTRFVLNRGAANAEQVRSVVAVAGTDPEGRIGPFTVTLNLPLGNDHAAGELVDVANDDSFAGGPGNDSIVGGPGDDMLRGDSGDDTLVDAGIVLLRVGVPDLADRVGGIRVSAGGGNDTMMGGDGNDTINGGPGNDRLAGDGDNDVVIDVHVEIRIAANEDLNGDGILNDGRIGVAGHGPLLDEDLDDIPGSGDEVDFNRDGDTNDLVNEDFNALAGNDDGRLDANVVARLDDPLIDPDRDGIPNLNRLAAFYVDRRTPSIILSGVFFALPPGSFARLSNPRPDLGGADVIDGGPGNDILAGGTGEDVIMGAAGDDVLMGSILANEHISFSSERPNGPFVGAYDGNDMLDGGPDNDALIDTSDRSGQANQGGQNTFLNGETVISQFNRSMISRVAQLQQTIFGATRREQVIVRPGRDVQNLLARGLIFADLSAEAEYRAALRADGSIDPKKLRRRRSQLDTVERFNEPGLGSFLERIGITPFVKSKGISAPARPDRAPVVLGTPDPARVDQLLDALLRGF
jgi:autotransporter-associated beta strand protein